MLWTICAIRVITVPNVYLDIIENIIFGFMDNCEQHTILNMIMYYAKDYIYSVKQYECNNVCFYQFLPRLTFNLEIELKIRMKKSKILN